MGFLQQQKSPLIAAALAVLGGVLGWVGLSQREKQVTQGWELVPAVVAAKNIGRGDVLSEANLRTALIPKRFFTGSALRPEDIPGRVMGQRAAVAMAEGDPLLATHVATYGSLRLAQKVAAKSRALAVRVTPESSVQNAIRASDSVDVIASIRDPQTQERVTLTLMQNVLVLATGDDSERRADAGGADSDRSLGLVPPFSNRNYATVTLQVSPDEAEELILAQEQGTLYFTLRNPEDEAAGSAHATATSLRTIASGERARMQGQKTNKQFQNVEVVRSGRTTEVKRFQSHP